MDWSIREGYAWVEDKEHCEEYGRMLQADPTKARLSHSIVLELDECSDDSYTHGACGRRQGAFRRGH